MEEYLVVLKMFKDHVTDWCRGYLFEDLVNTSVKGGVLRNT